MTNKPWYSPGEIVFNSHQIIWLLDNLPELRQGFWPTQPGVIQGEPVGKKPAPAPRAHFEKAVLISAELNRRLDDCYIDGMLVEWSFTFDVDDGVIAARLHKPLENIAYRIAACLWHIRGYDYLTGHYQRGNYANRVQSEREQKKTPTN